MEDSPFITETNQPYQWVTVNPLRLKQNGRDFADGILKSIFFNEDVWILIEISLEFVPKCSINDIPALVQIMVWCRPGEKALSEPLVVILLMHIQYVSLGLNELKISYQ